MSDGERRQAPRIMHGFLIRYRAAAEGEAGWFVSPLIDLSTKGARFLSERPFQVNTPLEIQLVLPNSKEPVAVTGHVVRTSPGRLGMTELGVVFDRVEPIAQERIEAAVTHFFRRQGGVP